ncbi:MAG: hypothetical protein KME16_21200 [Scytolyngbya sp. HA4215-MV1]|nr:hypothetical protein [Scytolyngbya sp. HA4215-MV1]
MNSVQPVSITGLLDHDTMMSVRWLSNAIAGLDKLRSLPPPILSRAIVNPCRRGDP